MDDYSIKYMKNNPDKIKDMLQRLNKRKEECKKLKYPNDIKGCIKFQNKMIATVKQKAKELAREHVVHTQISVTENFLQLLYTDKRTDAKEWQGPNIPYGDDSNRPNLIRQCMTLESDKMKINCLRKLRDQVAMNPFYQARLDRFVDAVTGIYEPTNKPGTIPGNEFKSSVVGEDLKESNLQEGIFDEERCKTAMKTLERVELIIKTAKKNIAECKRKNIDCTKIQKTLENAKRMKIEWTGYKAKYCK